MKKTGILILAVVFLFIFTGSIYADADKAKSTSLDAYYKELELFTDALSMIKNEYVEDVEPRKLVYGALAGLLGSLDSHSQFMEPTTYGEMKVDTTGKFGGLGVELTIRDGILTVVSVLHESPAAKAGLNPKDRIIKVDGQLIEDLSLMGAVDLLRGAPGSKVVLTIYRESTNEVFDVTVVRDIIKIDSVKNVQILEDNIGYIKITEFQEMTAKDFRRALKELSEQGMQQLIVDVRNNPGGLLDVAIDTTEFFLPEDALIVYTKSRIPEQNTEFRSKPGKKYLNMPLLILIDEGSASGSEIFAGAIQDHKRGLILGKTSFGKGSIQTVIPLSDGSAIRLTTSKYFTPRGVSIHGNGIVPDIEVDSDYSRTLPEPAEEKKGKLTQILEKFEGKKPDEAKKKKIVYDPQLSRAVDLMKALAIYKATKSGSE